MLRAGREILQLGWFKGHRQARGDQGVELLICVTVGRVLVLCLSSQTALRCGLVRYRLVSNLRLFEIGGCRPALRAVGREVPWLATGEAGARFPSGVAVGRGLVPGWLPTTVSALGLGARFDVGPVRGEGCHQGLQHLGDLVEALRGEVAACWLAAPAAAVCCPLATSLPGGRGAVPQHIAIRCDVGAPPVLVAPHVIC